MDALGYQRFQIHAAEIQVIIADGIIILALARAKTDVAGVVIYLTIVQVAHMIPAAETILLVETRVDAVGAVIHLTIAEVLLVILVMEILALVGTRVGAVGNS